MWIAQISDPHIRPWGVPYQGVVDSNAALAAAVDQLNRLNPQPDLVLLTGDLVDDGGPGDYQLARDILASLKARFLVIPGNHDERSLFRAAFADQDGMPTNGPINFVDDVSGPVRIVALDVTVPGMHHGAIDDASLGWLEGVLSSDADRPTVIMMHQPPITCDVPYLDRYRCMGGDRLSALVSRYPAVERILCGHVHRHMQMRFGGTLLCTAPSTATAIALRPYETAEIASSIEPPGFLLHHWRDGAMLTHSIPIGTFPGPYPFA
jgi:3',5'-cyclic AMP phosphodiesterase CpdA